MKKINSVLAIIMITICLCAGLTACTGTKNKEAENAEKAKQEMRLDINDLSWELTSGIIDKERFAVMNLTNNTAYTITDFSLKLSLKSDVTPEQKESFYNSIKSLNILKDEEFAKIKEDIPEIRYATHKMIKQKNACNNIHAYYFTGSIYLRDAAICELFEPDIATISYIKENLIVTTYYDFKTESYSDDPQSVDAFQWTEKALGSVIPKPTAEMVEVVYESDDSFDFTIHGTEKSDFQAYVEACKQQGFTKEAEEKDYKSFSIYDAKNENGYQIRIRFKPDDLETACTVYAPKK